MQKETRMLSYMVTSFFSTAEQDDLQRFRGVPASKFETTATIFGHDEADTEQVKVLNHAFKVHDLGVYLRRRRTTHRGQRQGAWLRTYKKHVDANIYERHESDEFSTRVTSPCVQAATPSQSTELIYSLQRRSGAERFASRHSMVGRA